MYLVTCEDSEGMWWDEPIAAASETDARALALSRWKDVPAGIALVLWRCDIRGGIDRPAPPPPVSFRDVHGILKPITD